MKQWQETERAKRKALLIGSQRDRTVPRQMKVLANYIKSLLLQLHTGRLNSIAGWPQSLEDFCFFRMKVLYHHVRPDAAAAVRFIEIRAHFTRPQGSNFEGLFNCAWPRADSSITIKPVSSEYFSLFFPRARPERNETLSLGRYCYYPADYCPKRFVLFHAGCSLRRKRNE
jgi:hypothetical protein